MVDFLAIPAKKKLPHCVAMEKTNFLVGCVLKNILQM